MDLDGAGFKDIDLGLYIRLGVWSHIGSSYRKTATEVKALCKVMFGYQLPEKIGRIDLRDYRSRSPAGLAKLKGRSPLFTRKRSATLESALLLGRLQILTTDKTGNVGLLRRIIDNDACPMSVLKNDPDHLTLS